LHQDLEITAITSREKLTSPNAGIGKDNVIATKKMTVLNGKINKIGPTERHSQALSESLNITT